MITRKSRLWDLSSAVPSNRDKALALVLILTVWVVYASAQSG